MKKIGLYLLPLVFLAGCAVQEVELAEAPSSGPHTVHFRATEMETRTTFGTPNGMSFPTLWTENDATVLVSVNNEEAQEVEVVPSQNYKTATISATFDDHSSYTFYAISPSAASAGMSPSRKAWKVTIPSEQTPLATSCDERAQILVAKTSEMETVPSEMDLPFKHLTAYMSITLLGLPEGTEVSSMELTMGVPLVGDYYYDCASGELTDNGASSTVTLSTDASGAVWVACAPVDLSGQPMTITVHTAAGNYVKKVKFPTGRELTPGKIGIFSVNMSGINPETSSTEDDPILDYEEYGAYLTSDTWVYVPATDHLSREYGDENLTFAILSPFKSTVMEFEEIPQDLSKGTQFTLVFNRQQKSSVTAHGSYKVSVVKESGNKVWLSDGAGNGFIIKK